MGREAASLTCRVSPLEVGQDRHIKPCLDSIKSLGGEGLLWRMRRSGGELRQFKVKNERGRLCG